jgi:hypothetical protein
MVRDRPAATPSQVQNLDNWFSNHPNAIIDDERFIGNPQDLLSVELRTKSYFRRLLEHSSLARTSSSRSTRYYSDALLDRVCHMLMAIAGLGLLFGPLWALPFINSRYGQLACITGFLVLLMAILDVSTTMKLTTRYICCAGYDIYRHLAFSSANMLRYLALLLIMMATNAIYTAQHAAVATAMASDPTFGSRYAHRSTYSSALLTCTALNTTQSQRSKMMAQQLARQAILSTSSEPLLCCCPQS